MSGGMYEGPGGKKLYGDGREVESVGEPPRAEPPKGCGQGSHIEGEGCADCREVMAGSRPSAPAPSGEPQYHELKTWPQYFESILRGEKRFEIRKFDRPFKVGDVLILKEYEPQSKTYSGREYWVRVMYMVSGAWGIPDDLAVMSIRPEVERYESSPVDLRDAARKWLDDNVHKNSELRETLTLTGRDRLVNMLAAFAAAVREGR